MPGACQARALPSAGRRATRGAAASDRALLPVPRGALLELGERLARLGAVLAHEPGVEAGTARLAVPLVVVEPRDPRAQATPAAVVLAGEREHVLRRARLAPLVLAERRQEREDAAGLGQPDLPRHEPQQLARAARAPPVDVDVVVQAED